MRDDGTLDDPYAPSRPTADSEDGTSTEPDNQPRAGSGVRPGPDRSDAGRPDRLALATGVVCCLGLTAVVQARDERRRRGDPERRSPAPSWPQRAEQSAPPVPSTARLPRAPPPPPRPPRRAPPIRTPAAGPQGAPARPTDPAPVAGLDQDPDGQRQGDRQDRPGDGRAAPGPGHRGGDRDAGEQPLQLASGVLPESQDYPHQAIGWDHDSVGLFQQRSSSGWGPVGRLMDPAFATRQFLSALEQVPGWQRTAAHRRRPGGAGLRVPRALRPARVAGDQGRLTPSSPAR